MWRELLLTASEVLGPGHPHAAFSKSWCSWTTFERLRTDAGYWQAGIPSPSELGEVHIQDGGTWGQPFKYDDLAHIIIPASFYFENRSDGKFTCGFRDQAIALLSQRLDKHNIEHRHTQLILEVKLY